MTIDALVRISIIREEVNKREIETNEEANRIVISMLDKFRDSEEWKVKDLCVEWMEDNNISLNNLNQYQILCRKKNPP